MAKWLNVRLNVHDHWPPCAVPLSINISSLVITSPPKTAPNRNVLAHKVRLTSSLPIIESKTTSLSTSPPLSLSLQAPHPSPPPFHSTPSRPNPTPQNSPTPPCPRPSPCHCLSALMLIITAEWIRRFPWMSAEPLACSVAPLLLLLLILSCFPSLPFPFSMGIKREGERRGMERVREGCFARTRDGFPCNCLICVTLPIKAVTANKPETLQRALWFFQGEAHILNVTLNLLLLDW